MKITYSIDDISTVFKVRNIETELEQVRDDRFMESNLSLENKDHREIYKTFGLEGIGIGFINRDSKNDVGYFVNSDFPYIQMHFEIIGHALYSPNSSREQKIEITQGTHTLFYLPVLNGHLVYPSVRGGFSVQIELTLDYLKGLFNGDLSFLGTFHDDITHQRPSVLGGTPQPLNTKLHGILMDMYYCPFVGQMKRLYIEGKIFELITTQINELTNNRFRGISKLGPAEMHIIAEAKRLIENNITHPYSIEALAQMLGTNRTKLQKNFRSTYGCTIFEMVSELRMQSAKTLLLSGKAIKVEEVALSIGFKNANHFSTAFKDKFGLLPKQLRSKGIS